MFKLLKKIAVVQPIFETEKKFRNLSRLKKSSSIRYLR